MIDQGIATRTGAKGRERLLSRGLARELPNGVLEMIQGDYRYMSEGRSEPRQSPEPMATVTESAWPGLQSMRTFDHYSPEGDYTL